MPNAAPATIVMSGSTGPGQTVTTLRFTDVNGIEVDFLRNWIKVTRAGSSGIQYYDYSASATVSWSISNGVTTVTIV